MGPLLPLLLFSDNAFADSFTRQDSSTTLGAPWLALQGTWGILGNTAQVVTASSADSASGLRDVAAFESGSNNVVVRVTNKTTSAPTGIAFRITDSLNFLMFVRTSAGYKLYRVVAGASTELGISQIAAAAGDVLQVTAFGPSITVAVNGGTPASVTDTYNQTATKHGLVARSYTGSLFDDFSITSL